MADLDGVDGHAERYGAYQQATNALDQVIGVMPHWPLRSKLDQAAYGQWIGEAI